MLLEHIKKKKIKTNIPCHLFVLQLSEIKTVHTEYNGPCTVTQTSYTINKVSQYTEEKCISLAQI